MGAMYLVTNVEVLSAKRIELQSTPVLLTHGRQNKRVVCQVAKEKEAIGKGMEPASSEQPATGTASSGTTAGSPMMALKGERQWPSVKST